MASDTRDPFTGCGVPSEIFRTVRSRNVRNRTAFLRQARVPIFPFATQGGKQASSYFRQRNWIQAREFAPGTNRKRVGSSDQCDLGCSGVKIAFSLFPWEQAHAKEREITGSRAQVAGCDQSRESSKKYLPRILFVIKNIYRGLDDSIPARASCTSACACARMAHGLHTLAHIYIQT